MTNSFTVESRILHILSVYPRISPSMLQISLSMPAGRWKPVFKRLLEEGKIKQTTVMAETQSGQMRPHPVVSLAPAPEAEKCS